MRPIKLIIKGLNSFVEEQVIDFNKLTERGLFGIFGPTGSGKSTILDGITLALYGKTSRDSSNYINTQVETMTVSYEFQIRGNEIKHYIVDRAFKRNKDGGINSSKPTRILEIINGETKVLDENASKVDKKCIEIIGLKFEDFVRTVVLPQGKFSEFLKLEGVKRREMLERLFSLEKYGDGLAKKLGSAIKKERSEMDKLTGQLTGYEEISEERYINKLETLKEKKKEEVEFESELKTLIKKLQQSENLWTLQLELQAHKKSQETLNLQKKGVDKYRILAEKGENAIKAQPYIEALNSTIKSINNTENCLIKDQKTLQELKVIKDELEVDFSIVRKNKDIRLPDLKVLCSKVEDAIKEQRLKVLLEIEILNLNKKHDDLHGKKKQYETRTLKLEENIFTLNNKINTEVEKLDTLKVNETHKNKVNEGLVVQGKLEEAHNTKNKFESNVNKTSDSIIVLKENIKKIQSDIDIKDKNLSGLTKELEKMSNNCPGDTDILLAKQGNIATLKVNIDKGNSCKIELDKLNMIMDELRVNIEKNKEVKIKLNEEIMRLKKIIEDKNRENLASILRAELNDGAECPVCGSTEHKNINHNNADTDTIVNEEKKLKDNEGELLKIERNLSSDEGKLKLNSDRKIELENELNNLGDQWSKIDINQLNAEFTSQKIAMEKWTTDKENLEKNIKILKDDLNKLEIELVGKKSACKENEKSLEKYSLELTGIKENFHKLTMQCNELKQELGIDDFYKRNEEIKKIVKQREGLEITIKRYREDVKNEAIKKDELKKENEELIGKLATIKTQVSEKKNQIEEKEKNIKVKTGERTDLENYKSKILQEIKNIEETFNKLEEDKNLIEEKCKKCESDVNSGQLQLLQLKSRYNEENIKLINVLEDEGFNDSEEVKTFLISKEKILQLRNSIKEYENNVNQLQGKILDVINKIDGRKITDEQWAEIQELMINKENDLKKTRDMVAEINTELKELRKNLDKLKELMTEKEKLVHKLSLLSDLETLFKGKRFVEFVATSQLKYISLEASKRLKEITTENYGLEADESGKFIIRDYKNGGATRDASTLSGGETFLASLALALALSTQIQLKGTAPLELFFLDEGFGTLDDNLLEVVMGSLEKLHNDTLSVGIISHVESIKNRVPVKLILKSAEAGASGSKVKIEKT